MMKFSTYQKGMKTMRKTWFLIALAGGMLAAATANARHCGPSLAVYDGLEESYGERRISIAEMTKRIEEYGIEVMVEVWANTETGSWTHLETFNGMSCVTGSGENYILDDTPAEPTAQGEPT